MTPLEIGASAEIVTCRCARCSRSANLPVMQFSEGWSCRKEYIGTKVTIVEVDTSAFDAWYSVLAENGELVDYRFNSFEIEMTPFREAVSEGNVVSGASYIERFMTTLSSKSHPVSKPSETR